MPSQEKDEVLTVRINSPEEIIWEGEANALSSKNSRGKFDILPEHANFITIVDNNPIIVHQKSGDLTFNFYYAVIHTEDNFVKIFAHI